MDINSLRYYLLERGIAIAIYGMTPDRQLPLESYVGYTLFKNGFPAAYGGGWVFGQRSLFGINIADSFRGGESGYIMCQLLRVYRQVFGVDYFEVEPYQYGYDNSEGIKSGAFWFYYRYGFRLLDRKLRRLAEQENKKINAGKNYRTPEKTLLKFTESNMALNLGNEIPLQVSKVTEKTTMLFKSKYKNDRVKAEEEIVRKFISRAGETEIDNKFEEQVLREVALFSEVMNIHDPDKIALLRQMIKTKPYDLYLYQELLLKLLSKK
jgi:hypothetical protein